MPYKDPEEMRQWRRRYRVKQRACTRDWERRNPDKVRASQSRARAKRRALRTPTERLAPTRREAKRGVDQRRAEASSAALESTMGPCSVSAFDPDETTILELIYSRRGICSAKALRYHTQIPEVKLRCALQRLRNHGVIEVIGPSRGTAIWNLVPEGRLQ